MEEWKIYDKNPKYSVSNMGRVRKTTNSGNTPIDVYIIPKHKGKYRLVCDEKLYILLHTLVGEVWLPKLPNTDNIKHINGDTHDNRASNLEWYRISRKGGRRSKASIVTTDSSWEETLSQVTFRSIEEHTVINDNYIISPIPGSTKWSVYFIENDIPKHMGIYDTQKEAEIILYETINGSNIQGKDTIVPCS